MGRVAGKVALVTGAARGQGRNHAIRLAEQGADLVLVDLCEPIASVPYELPKPVELEEVGRSIEALDRRVLTRYADVRDQATLDRVVADAVDEFGRLDIVCANAGIATFGMSWELTDEQWQATLDVNLTGVWRTVKAAVPTMIDAGRGGSLILTSSVLGSIGIPQLSHYGAAKHGVMGLMRSLANELGPHGIRVNCVQPGSIHTKMIDNEFTLKAFRPDLQNPTMDDAVETFASLSSLPVTLLDVDDITNAVLWLASDESRHVTGTGIVVDGGWANK